MNNTWNDIFKSEPMKAVGEFNTKCDDFNLYPQARAVGFCKKDDDFALIIATPDHDTRIEVQSKIGTQYMGYPLQFDVAGGPPRDDMFDKMRRSAKWVRRYLKF